MGSLLLTRILALASSENDIVQALLRGTLSYLFATCVCLINLIHSRTGCHFVASDIFSKNVYDLHEIRIALAGRQWTGVGRDDLLIYLPQG
jgi:hypothetical protein